MGSKTLHAITQGTYMFPGVPSIPPKAALPGAFPICPWTSEEFPALTQEIFSDSLPSPGQEQDYTLTLHQAVRGQNQGHI